MHVQSECMDYCNVWESHSVYLMCHVLVYSVDLDVPFTHTHTNTGLIRPSLFCSITYTQAFYVMKLQGLVCPILSYRVMGTFYIKFILCRMHVCICMPRRIRGMSKGLHNKYMNIKIRAKSSFAGQMLSHQTCALLNDCE